MNRIAERSSRVIAVIALSVILAGCVSIEESVKTPPETNVTYLSGDGTELVGFLALPPGDGPHPAVVMIHEWWGLNQDIVILAQALAEEGFAVLAPDAMRGELATSVAAAISLNRSTPEEQIFADLDVAVDFLRRQPEVDPNRIATMGFCFGGRQSMYLGTRRTDLAAVVTLYGSGLLTEAAELGSMAENGPVLGIFGEADRTIPLREVEAFDLALDEIGVPHQITVYPDMGHAFVKSSTYKDDGAAGQAWQEVVSFLNGTIAR